MDLDIRKRSVAALQGISTHPGCVLPHAERQAWNERLYDANHEHGGSSIVIEEGLCPREGAKAARLTNAA